MPTITEATKGNAGDHGNFFWDLKLDDGRTAWMLAKNDVSVGEEVVEHSEKNGKLRVKRPDKDAGGSADGGRKDPNGLKREAYGSALHAAVAFAALKGVEVKDSSDLTRVADVFYEATMAKLDL